MVSPVTVVPVCGCTAGAKAKAKYDAVRLIGAGASSALRLEATDFLCSARFSNVAVSLPICYLTTHTTRLFSSDKSGHQTSLLYDPTLHSSVVSIGLVFSIVI